jgi:cobalt-zinc-cadmium efflux system membrane fusion protein
MRSQPWIWTAAAALALLGCHEHPHGGHDDHGHGHGAHGHGAQGHEAQAEDDHHGHGEGVAYTTYAQRTELFVEVPTLVVDHPVELAAHVTTVADFKAVALGGVMVELSGGPSPDERFTVDAPSIPGIFRPVVHPLYAGPRTMRIRVMTADIDEVHVVAALQVFEDHAEAEAAAAAADVHDDHTEGEISFTKEQQWRIDFATQAVTSQMIRPSFEAYGTIRARPDGEAMVSAPVAGRVAVSPGLPRMGQRVERDEVLAVLTPRLPDAADMAGLEQGLAESRLAKKRAWRELSRLEKLLASGGVAERRVLDARYELELASAQHGAASRRLEQATSLHSASGDRPAGSVDVRAPLGGTVVKVEGVPGGFAQTGKHLIHIVDLERLWLEVHVTETHAKYLEEPQGVWFKIAAFDEVMNLGPDDVVAVGGVLDARTRTVPLYMTVANPKGRLRVGMFADVHVLMDAPHLGLAVASSAVVFESGLPVVYVALGGESFSRRPVRVGQRDGESVEILEGLAEGERVVSIGAYAVRLATLTTQIPEHGHSH